MVHWLIILTSDVVRISVHLQHVCPTAHMGASFCLAICVNHSSSHLLYCPGLCYTSLGSQSYARAISTTVARQPFPSKSDCAKVTTQDCPSGFPSWVCGGYQPRKIPHQSLLHSPPVSTYPFSLLSSGHNTSTISPWSHFSPSGTLVSPPALSGPVYRPYCGSCFD